jgi:hypothetical protein
VQGLEAFFFGPFPFSNEGLRADAAGLFFHMQKFYARPENDQLLGVTVRCRDCERLRRYIDQQRDHIGGLELRLEGAAQRAKLT